ncbi:lysocardiolipin acyltransferase 1-like, partial [Mantella aurantiaca]
DNLDAVHDITVAYPRNIPQTERHILSGDFPREIHFHVIRYPVDCLPISREDLQRWCQDRWREKEERLRLFYEGHRYFDVTGRSKIPPCKSELRVLCIKMASLLYWTSFTAASLLGLYMYSPLRWYTVSAVLFYVLQEKIFGGLELMELACHRYHSKP